MAPGDNNTKMIFPNGDKLSYYALSGSIAGGSIAAGTYGGTEVDNTAVAHSLGQVPKYVTIGNSSDVWSIYGTDPTTLIRDTVGTTTVTAMDSTNFYVAGVANVSGNVYNWVAFV